MTALIVPVLLLAACAEPTCEELPSGKERDVCFHDRVRLAPQAWTADQLLGFVDAIQDPIVRDATVMVWVREHRGATSDRDRRAVCGRLGGLERGACERRLSSAHLAR